MGKLNLKNITLVSICGDSRFLSNILKAAKHCLKYADFYKVKILSNILIPDKDIEIVKIPNLNKEQYSLFSLYELPNHIDSEFCLTFQGDGYIIDNSYWSDSFLNFDYIGAPWVNQNKNCVGNGGFSLRSEKFLCLAKTLDYNSKIQFQKHIPAGQLITPEDWFACCYSYDKMTDMGVKFADINTAYQFSVEHPSLIKNYNRYNLSTYKSFGFHGEFNTAAMKLLEQK